MKLIELAQRGTEAAAFRIVVLMTVVSLGCEERRPATTASITTPPKTVTAEQHPAPATTATTIATEKKCVPGRDVLCPVDEGGQDPSFAEYRQRLLAAIEKRSSADLLPLVDIHIRTSFGDGSGRAAFEKQWRLSSPGSPLWSELSEIVRLGGSFQGEGDRSFWAPYVYSAWPEDIDAFTHVAAIRANVPLRDQPSTSGKVLRSLDWSILELIDSKQSAWRYVRTSDGTAGWGGGRGRTQPDRLPRRIQSSRRPVEDDGVGGWRLSANRLQRRPDSTASAAKKCSAT